jgi:hypothetical protein
LTKPNTEPFRLGVEQAPPLCRTPMKWVSRGSARFSPSVGHRCIGGWGFVTAEAVTAVRLASGERESYGAAVTFRPPSASAARGNDQGELLEIPPTEANLVVARQLQS